MGEMRVSMEVVIDSSLVNKLRMSKTPVDSADEPRFKIKLPTDITNTNLTLAA